MCRKLRGNLSKMRKKLINLHSFQTPLLCKIIWLMWCASYECRSLQQQYATERICVSSIFFFITLHEDKACRLWWVWSFVPTEYTHKYTLRAHVWFYHVVTNIWIKYMHVLNIYVQICGCSEFTQVIYGMMQGMCILRRIHAHFTKTCARNEGIYTIV
jgi:hypothetical protein